MKMVFILQVASHARYWRRIDMLSNLGVEIKTYSFERDYYEGKSRLKKYVSLGNVERESYLKRILPILRSIFLLRKDIKNVDVIYSFGMDTFIIGWFASLFKNKKAILVYEVGDIRAIFTKKGLIPRIFRFIEKLIVKRADLLVVTSEAYVDGYFKSVQNLNRLNYHVIENKPELKSKRASVNDKENFKSSKIRIGFFGVLRCSRSLEVLKRLIEQHSDKFELYIRGIVVEGQDIIDELTLMDNVKFEGEYRVPDDLISMYNQIDIIWACYPYNGKDLGNWMWAKTTRFYEASYFKKPMITLRGTQDSFFVREKGIGLDLDLSNINLSVKKLSQLTESQLKDMIENYDGVSADVYTYSNEHEELMEKLKR